VNGKQAGFGLMEVLVAAGLGTVVVAALMFAMQRMSQFNQKVESSTDLSGIRARLAESVNCTRTFQAQALPLGNPCPTGQFINLFGGGGQMVVPAAGLVVGQWTVRAYCRSGDGSLDIRAAKVRPGAPATAIDWPTGTVDPANFLRDTMGGNAGVGGTNASSYSWIHPKSRLFPAGGGGLCSNWFAGTPGGSCAPNQYISNIDFNSNTVTCLPLPPTPPVCAAGMALRFNGTAYTCDANYEQRANDARNDANNFTNAKTTVVTASAGMGPVGYGCALIGPNFGYTGTVSCPAGHKVIGGDVSCWLGGGGIPSFSARSGNGWTGICCSASMFGGANTVRAFCIPN
jgi:hypothetical protein